MEIKKMMGLILISLCSLCWTSCSDDDGQSISLMYVDNNALNLSYPALDGYATSILGGDGNYTITCDDPSILDVKLIEGQTASFFALSLGDTKVRIKDQSNHSCVLNVTISYRTSKMSISKIEVKIEGDNLTETEKSELKEKAIATVPVKINGGYKFEYIDGSGNSGKLYIYPETSDKNGTEGTFQINRGESGGNSYPIYEMSFNNKKQTFILNPYQSQLRTSIVAPHAFVEDVTEQFKADYPNLKSIYTLQVINNTISFPK